MCRNSFRIRAERKTGQLLKDTPKKLVLGELVKKWTHQPQAHLLI